MWTRNLVILLLFQLAISQDHQNVAENSEIKSINKSNNITHNNENNKNEKVITQQEITKIPQNNTVEGIKAKENDEISNNANLPISAIDLNADELDFKYYWFLLVGSSLAIIGLIAFKSFRMRRSRAEVRYGKPTASDEIEPLGSSNSKWDDESSSENEDEIFDINFLKNTRLQKHSDNV